MFHDYITNNYLIIFKKINIIYFFLINNFIIIIIRQLYNNPAHLKTNLLYN
uniref:Uncharacterized protein n=1 Tax=viral metagenome TaxID=1070528 RepID=A0A6C0H6A5_9ZZZZ